MVRWRPSKRTPLLAGLTRTLGLVYDFRGGVVVRHREFFDIDEALRVLGWTDPGVG